MIVTADRKSLFRTVWLTYLPSFVAAFNLGPHFIWYCRFLPLTHLALALHERVAAETRSRGHGKEKLH